MCFMVCQKRQESTLRAGLLSYKSATFTAAARSRFSRVRKTACWKIYGKSVREDKIQR